MRFQVEACVALSLSLCFWPFWGLPAAPLCVCVCVNVCVCVLPFWVLLAAPQIYWPRPPLPRPPRLLLPQTLRVMLPLPPPSRACCLRGCQTSRVTKVSVGTSRNICALATSVPSHHLPNTRHDEWGLVLRLELRVWGLGRWL